MLINFDIKNIQHDNDTINRMSKYLTYKDLYNGNFNRAFSSTIMKIRKRYPLDNTTSQSLIRINLFNALTELFKGFLTNQGLNINVDDEKQKICTILHCILHSGYCFHVYVFRIGK